MEIRRRCRRSRRRTPYRHERDSRFSADRGLLCFLARTVVTVACSRAGFLIPHHHLTCVCEDRFRRHRLHEHGVCAGTTRLVDDVGSRVRGDDEDGRVARDPVFAEDLAQCETVDMRERDFRDN
jgi:hypothetical protein